MSHRMIVQYGGVITYQYLIFFRKNSTSIIHVLSVSNTRFGVREVLLLLDE